MVKSVSDEMGNDDQLRNTLDINGKISFENQASFQQAEVGSLGHVREGLNVRRDKDQK